MGTSRGDPSTLRKVAISAAFLRNSFKIISRRAEHRANILPRLINMTACVLFAHIYRADFTPLVFPMVLVRNYRTALRPGACRRCGRASESLRQQGGRKMKTRFLVTACAAAAIGFALSVST